MCSNHFRYITNISVTLLLLLWIVTCWYGYCGDLQILNMNYKLSLTCHCHLKRFINKRSLWISLLKYLCTYTTRIGESKYNFLLTYCNKFLPCHFELLLVTVNSCFYLSLISLTVMSHYHQTIVDTFQL